MSEPVYAATADDDAREGLGEPDMRTFGKRAEAKLYYCDNCCRHHWGHYEQVGGWEFTEWDFIWTTPQGARKSRSPC